MHIHEGKGNTRELSYLWAWGVKTYVDNFKQNWNKTLSGEVMYVREKNKI
jgi:hypothetical protein